jgi:hypothetical protein
MQFLVMYQKLLLTQPRGEVLEYFESQKEVATKAIFNLPRKMNASTYWGRDGPTLLCQILGYDLNPDVEEMV